MDSFVCTGTTFLKPPNYMAKRRMVLVAKMPILGDTADQQRHGGDSPEICKVVHCSSLCMCKEPGQTQHPDRALPINSLWMNLL